MAWRPSAPRVRRVRMPAANGTGTRTIGLPRSTAVRPPEAPIGLSPAVPGWARGAAVPPSRGRDKVLRVDTSFSSASCKPAPFCLFGSVGQRVPAGAGGSFGFADPDTGVGFACVMNKAGFHLAGDPVNSPSDKRCSATYSGSVSRCGTHRAVNLSDDAHCARCPNELRGIIAQRKVY